MEKKRTIVDYKNVPDEILEAIAVTYPDGYEHAITKFKNAKGETVKAIRVETDDTIYLVKVSVELAEMVEDLDPDDIDFSDDDYDVGGEARDFKQEGPDSPEEESAEEDDDDDDY